jgi:hypothetical protein
MPVFILWCLTGEAELTDKTDARFLEDTAMRRFLIAVFVALPMFALAQAPAVPDRPPAEPAPSAELPVRRVVLYKTGVGYFEHLGNVRDRQSVSIRFTSAQLNDVLNSMTVLDLGKGQITGISYNSVAPLEQRLGALRLPLDAGTTQVRMLASLRGARVEVTSGTGAVAGRLLSVEQRAVQRGDDKTLIDTIAVVTDAGEIRTFELSPTVRVRVVERDLRQEIGRYLDVVGTAREQDVRTMVISTTGAGERPLFVSYVSEVPIWKSTYRLVLGSKGKPLLQGWAVIDNTIGVDWRDVELSLVAGAPQSFIQNISQPYYSRRPVVPMPSSVLLAPQTHQASLGDGAGSVRGIVRDNAGAVIPGATVRLLGPSGVVATSISGPDGRYEMTVPAGVYSLRAELQGFSPRVIDSWRVASGTSVQQDLIIEVAGLSESVTVSAEAPASRFRQGGLAGGLGGGAGGRLAPQPLAAMPMPLDVYEQARNVAPQALGASLGDLFEYRIKEPISLTKNQSALVPIVNAEIEAERVSLWNRTTGNGRPLRAVWLTNATGLTLDGGSMTLIDGEAFAGEGLLESLKPGEKRLLSYAADLGVMVQASKQSVPGRILRLRARDGVITQEIEERATSSYRARNENTTATTLIIEHRVEPGWKLADGHTPVESTADTQRFRMVLPTAKETILEVREVRQGATAVMIGNIDKTFVAQLVQAGIPAANLERELKPIIDKNAELMALERRGLALENERTGIDQDQDRLRENMKALKGSAEERQLLQRYTRQLDQQETRLETLKTDIDRMAADVERVRGELSALIASLSFDLTAR